MYKSTLFDWYNDVSSCVAVILTILLPLLIVITLPEILATTVSLLWKVKLPVLFEVGGTIIKEGSEAVFCGIVKGPKVGICFWTVIVAVMVPDKNKFVSGCVTVMVELPMPKIVT